MVFAPSVNQLEVALADLVVEQLRNTRFHAILRAGNNRSASPAETAWQETELATEVAALSVALTDADDPAAREMARLAKSSGPIANWGLDLTNVGLHNCEELVDFLKQNIARRRRDTVAELRASVDLGRSDPAEIFRVVALLSRLGEFDSAETLLQSASDKYQPSGSLAAAQVTLARDRGELAEGLRAGLAALRRWPTHGALQHLVRELSRKLRRLSDLEWSSPRAGPDTNPDDLRRDVEDLLRQNKTAAAIETLWEGRNLLLGSPDGLLSLVRFLLVELHTPALAENEDFIRLVDRQPPAFRLALTRQIPSSAREAGRLLSIAQAAHASGHVDDLAFWRLLCRTAFDNALLVPSASVGSEESANWILARCSAERPFDIYAETTAGRGFNVPHLNLKSLRRGSGLRTRWGSGGQLSYATARESLTARGKAFFEEVRGSRVGAFIFTVHAWQDVGLQKQLLAVAACSYGLRTTGLVRRDHRTHHPGEEVLAELPLAPEYLSRRFSSAIDLATNLTGAVKRGGVVHLPVDFVDGWHSADTIIVPGFVRPHQVAEFNARIALMSEGRVAFGACFTTDECAFVVDVAPVSVPSTAHAITTRSTWLLQRIARTIRASYLEQQIPIGLGQIEAGGGLPLERPMVMSRDYLQACPQARGSLFGRLLFDPAVNGEIPAICTETSQATFGQLRRRSLSCAEMILHFQELKPSHARGTRFRDQHRVLAVLKAGETLAELGLGALVAGSLFCVCHPDSSIATIQHRLETFRPDLVVLTASIADSLVSSFRGEDVAFLICDDTCDGETTDDLTKGFPPATRLPPFDPNRPALAVFTAGSTAKPKGVVVSHSIHSFGYDGTEPLVYGNRHAAIVRWDTIGFAGLLTTLRRGTSVYVPPRSATTSPALLIDYLRTRKINALSAPSTIWHSLAQNERFTAGTLAHFRGGVAWGERLSAPAVETIAAKFPAIWLALTYGATEASHVSLNVLIEDGKLRGDGQKTLVRPSFGTNLRILDESGLDITNTGQVGLLEVTGPNVMLGYYDELYAKNPPMADGAVRSITLNDMVSRTDDGSIVWVGRADTVVKIAGRRVSLTEIEAAAETMPGVRRAIAFAHEGDLTPEIWLALEAPADTNSSAVGARVAELTASEARPRRIKILEAFPVLDSGKADRRALRQVFEQDGVGPLQMPQTRPPPQSSAAAVLARIELWLKRNDSLDDRSGDVAEAALADNYIDSIAQLDLLMFLEKEFEVTINYEHMPVGADLTFASLANAVARSMDDRSIAEIASQSGTPSLRT